MVPFEPEYPASETKDGPASSRPTRHSPGGVSKASHASLKQAWKASQSLTGTGKLAATLLIRLIREYAGGGVETAPRWNGKKIVRELVSKRLSIPKMRGRAVTAKRPVLIAVDSSGSCSAYAQDTLNAAVAAYRACPGMVHVLIHSNGEYMGYDYGKRKDSVCYLGDIADPHRWWEAGYSLVVNFGDTDAMQQMQAVVQNGSKLLWLDSYRKNCNDPFRSVQGPSCFKAEHRQQVAAWDGVGDAADLVKVLRQQKKF